MPAHIAILDYEPAHQPAFRALNREWIVRYFALDPIDNQMLDDPEGYIRKPGGHIFMASADGDLVGTCALLNEHDGVYELAKMAVAPRAQGLGIGWLLGQAAVAKARALGGRRVELLSNSRLTPALALYAKLGFWPVPVPATPYQRTDVTMVLDL